MRNILLLFPFAVFGIAADASAQFQYDIASLPRTSVNCAALAATPEKNASYVVSSLVRASGSPASSTSRKKTRKRSRKKRAVAASDVTMYEAKPTSEIYDPHAVLAAGFALSVWVVPFASPAPGHGYVLYPLQGRSACGLGHSQWGFTVGKDYVRVYENYTSSKLILQYRHNEKRDFFLTLTCSRSGVPSLYINGALVQTGAPSPYSPHPALNGAAACPASMKFIGKTAELHFFTRALAADEIMGLYKKEYALLHHVK